MQVPLNLDCNSTIRSTFKVCYNNNLDGLTECGAGSCCGNITDLNSGQILNCNVCGPTSSVGGSKWFLMNSSGILKS